MCFLTFVRCVDMIMKYLRFVGVVMKPLEIAGSGPKHLNENSNST